MLTLLPILAQDFLKGARAEDLMLDRIEVVSALDTIGISNWHDFFYKTKNIAINKDGRQRAEARTKGRYGDGIWIVDLVGYKEKQIDTRGVVPKWSPDGQRIAYIKQRIRAGEFWQGRQLYGEYELWIYSLATEEKNKITSGIAVGEFAWGTEGKIIALEYYNMPTKKNNQNILGILDIDTKEITVIDKGSPYFATNFSLSPNGKMIAYCKHLEWKLKTDWWLTSADLFISNINGSNKMQVTNTEAVETMVKWLNNGKSLIVEQCSPDPLEYPFTHYVKILLKKKNRRAT